MDAAESLPARPAAAAQGPIAPNVALGFGRAMMAMSAFSACKADYEASLKDLVEGSAEYVAALEGAHAR